MPDKPYEFLEHTADICVRIYGKDLPEIFINAARAMFEVLAEKREGIRLPQTSIDVTLTGGAREELLINWLNELLYLYSTKEIVFSGYQIHRLTIEELEATVAGESAAGYIIKTEIKAATYHDLKIEQTLDEWQAIVIFDV